LTEDEESARRQKEFAERSELFMNALDVDEMVGQVLASEGFSSVEEVAYVDQDEVASIDGFDDDTAEEIQARARDHIDEVEAVLDGKRQELGVSDALLELPHVTLAMLVAFGEDGVQSLEDFAGYAVDDLVGWKERKDGENVVYDGVLTPFETSRAHAEEMVTTARSAMGWLNEGDEVPEDAEEGADIPDQA